MSETDKPRNSNSQPATHAYSIYPPRPPRWRNVLEAGEAAAAARLRGTQQQHNLNVLDYARRNH